jgi:hypothetical protein
MTSLQEITPTILDTLMDTINNIRETTIASHYNAAVADLQDQIKNSPLQTKFVIYSGCVSEEIALEIASRIQTVHITASVQTTGFFTTTYYLAVEVALPASLIRDTKVEEVNKVEEVDKVEEVNKVEEVEEIKEEIKPVTTVIDEPLHTE